MVLVLGHSNSNWSSLFKSRNILLEFFSFRILEVGETIPYPVMKTKFEFLDKDVKPAAPELSQPQVSFPAKH